MPLLDSAPATVAAVPPPATRRASLVVELIRLVRPTHWVKSLLVVPLPLLDPASWHPAGLLRLGWSVLAFVLAASAVYVGNDVADRHRDGHHPVKRHRPVASGRVPVPLAYACAAVLLLGLALLLAAGLTGPAWPVLLYLALNVWYSRGLKHVPLVEAGVVATGFVLRAVQGYLAVGTAVSAWLLITVFAGCLLLIIGKRRQELLEAGVAHRPALHGWSVELAGHLLQLTGVLAVTAGLVWLGTEAPFDPYGEAAMLLSTPFVLYLMSRYLQLALVRRAAGDPVRLLLRDRAVVTAVVLWAACLGALYAATRFPALVAALS
ncbi:UbiA prenyltransferase family protein [Micromonospora auratinigra]|uniref:Decaprenyl-phosphate phosphoribosyltransferase n=1 Tax=Micromonospora auratinigra TaxID=261654 RepID=A0A1A8ZHA7_9ACTN|nr:UbiA prenyltransferase family protein [Micromonospora auratinigra]SBT43260.1 decaprenyl-phosphate phosphoribosyltransferase [Micromonospora auratinigra]